jgi:hypothetical protein
MTPLKTEKELQKVINYFYIISHFHEFKDF